MGHYHRLTQDHQQRQVTRASGASGRLYMHLQIFQRPPSGLFIVFANAHFIVNSRWTSDHFSNVEICFFAGAKPESVIGHFRQTIKTWELGEQQ